MIILKPKKLLCWILFGLIAYQVFGYVKMQTYDDVVVYKRLATAIMKDDDYMIQHVSVKDASAKILKTQIARDDLFDDSNILLTYYRVKSRSLSADGQSAYLTVEQVSRVNPPGYDTLWGEHFVRLRHEVRLAKINGRWMVTSFEDPVIKP